MACLHPLKAFKIGINEKTGKNKYKIVSFKVNFIVKTMYNGCVKYICHDGNIKDYKRGMCDVCILTEWIEIPCGKCISCRRRYAAVWSDRLMLELENHEEACFLTLTYDDDHIFKVDSNYIECSDHPLYSLNKRDLQLFLKRLRKYLEPKKIRFFACGEYGDRTFRPHYHMILFGWRPSDLVEFRRNFQGDVLYLSDELAKIWRNGHVIVGNVTQQSCRYVARYVMKKSFGVDREFYAQLGVMPEFIQMSRNPGIGREYFELHYDDIAKYKTINISTPDGGKSVSIPPYYVNLIESVDPDLYREIKESNRRAAELRKECIMRGTTLDYTSYLSMCEGKLERQEEKYERGDY